MALHVGHNCVPWGDCDVCGAKVEPSYRQRGDQRTDVCAMCGAGFTVCRCRHQLREWRENMAKLVGAYETIDHREVNGWTVTLFRNLSHNGTQPHGSFSATVREGVSEDVLSFYGETREAVEREVLHIVGVSPLNAAALVEENAALRAEVAALRAENERVIDDVKQVERAAAAVEALAATVTVRAMPYGRVLISGPHGAAFMHPMAPLQWWLILPVSPNPDVIMTSTVSTEVLAEVLQWCEHGIFPSSCPGSSSHQPPLNSKADRVSQPALSSRRVCEDAMIVCMTCQMEMQTCDERSTAWVAQTQLEHPVEVVRCPRCGCTVADVNLGIERHSHEAEPGVLVLDLKEETPCESA